MASNSSFDISTGYDPQEVDNAVNQANKELANRYDFRDVKFEIDFKKNEHRLFITAPDDYKLNAIWDVLQGKMIKRGVPIKNLHKKDPESSLGGNLKQEINLQNGIETDTAKKIVKFIKDQKIKKVQASIQKDEVRVTSPSKDALQDVMGILKNEDFGIELQFGNYR